MSNEKEEKEQLGGGEKERVEMLLQEAVQTSVSVKNGREESEPDKNRENRGGSTFFLLLSQTD